MNEPNQGKMLVRSIAIDAVPGTTDSFKIKIMTTGYGPYTFNVGPTLTEQPPIEVGLAPAGIITKGWRQDPLIPVEADPGVGLDFPASAWSAAGGDIGGTKVDFNTSPVDVVHRQSAFKISVVRRMPYLDWLDNTTASSGTTTVIDNGVDVSALEVNVLSRNRVQFLNQDIGSILFKSLTTSRLHFEYLKITLDLVYDDWAHASQFPKSLTEKNISGPKTYTNGIATFDDVYFRQPYLGSFDPEEYFNPQELAIINGYT